MRRASLLLMLAPCLAACPGEPGAVTDAGVSGDGEAIDAARPAPVVDTPSGPVRGVAGPGYREFLAIPYAMPPVGELRWRPPRPMPRWTEPRDATRRPAACPQRAFTLDTGEEDCLYVNVHTPDPPPEDAPVMVWLHGGGFIFGEGVQTDGGTRGDVLAAAHGVVVVSVNYRLGPLGFFPHPALSSEDGASSGNQGFEDQVAALRWVRDNVSAFGGDPANVTLFGESAGGLSACLHLVSPASAGLFARIIAQSGLCDDPLPSAAQAETAAIELGIRLGCDGAADASACLREQTSDRIFDVDDAPTGATALLAERSWWPHVDGEVVPGQLRDLVAAGRLERVPTVLGWNADEGTLFVAAAELEGLTVDETAYRDGLDVLAARHGVDVADLLAAYPLDRYADPGAALAAALGHATIACPSRRAAWLLAEHVELRAYRFEFPRAEFQLPLERDLGAFHSAEIQYVFGHPAALGRTRHTGEDFALHEMLAGYWTRFARTGDPDGDGAQAWPAWDPSTDRHLVLDVEPRLDSAADRDACALWDR